MDHAITSRYRRWFDYERNAHAKILASLDTVPEEGRTTPEYRRALGIAAHIITARRIWLDRLKGLPPAAGPLFPVEVSLEEVAETYRETEPRWETYLAGLDDAAMERVIEYKSLDGKEHRSRVEDILAQLFGHSWYHRGQIAMLVRSAGGEPAATDLIHWLRETTAEV
jgi:uncharacterized damage-inducible protein DinB